MSKENPIDLAQKSQYPEKIPGYAGWGKNYRPVKKSR